MPSLERLTIGGDELDMDGMRMLSRLMSSWTGLAIRYLNVRDRTPFKEKMSILAEIIAGLPHLEHLVCPSGCIRLLQPHAELRWIDGWNPNPLGDQSKLPVLEPSSFPQLEGIRFISILLSELYMLPFSMPPSFRPEKEGVKWSFRSGNIHFIYERRGIDLDTSTLWNEQPFASNRVSSNTMRYEW